MLLYFILGILFISLGIPILDALSSIVSAWSQYIVYIFAFKIYAIKSKMGAEGEEEQEEKQVLGFTSAIGIEVPNETEQLYDDDDQEE